MPTHNLLSGSSSGRGCDFHTAPGLLVWGGPRIAAIGEVGDLSYRQGASASTLSICLEKHYDLLDTQAVTDALKTL